MASWILILVLAALFFVLGQGASFLVDNLRRILRGGRVSPLLAGLILGFLTTLPELIVGLNAIHRGIPGISLGNLFGGLVVILGLVLGIGILFNGQIKNNGGHGALWHNLIFIALPLIMALKGYINWLDGIFLLAVYVSLILSFYYCGHQKENPEHHHLLLGKNLKEIENKLLPWFLALVGVALVIATSGLIIKVAEMLLLRWGLEPVFIGLVLFSLGTNLPELVVAIKSGMSKSSGIALNHVLGSAAANALILGILSLFTTFEVVLNFNFWITFAGIIILLLCFGWFYTSQKRLSRWEGAIFLLVYLLFMAAQFWNLFK